MSCRFPCVRSATTSCALLLMYAFLDYIECMSAMTSIRVSTTTRDKVSHLAQSHGMSQAAYLEQLVKEKAEEEAEQDFWARMDDGGGYDTDDWAEFSANEAVALAEVERHADDAEPTA